MKSIYLYVAPIALVVSIALGWFAWNNFSGERRVRRPPSPIEVSSMQGADGSAVKERVVILSDTKIAAAGIRAEPVTRELLQLTRTLPGRFAYDDTQHVSLRTPTDGVLESVLVKAGDTVDRGQPVAVLRSPSIGKARNEVLTRQADFDLAEKEYRWEADVHDGVRDLVRRIRMSTPVDTIERELQDEILGDIGGQLLTAYSKSKLASRISRSVGSVGESGAISRRVIQERESEQQQATATLEAVIEQSLFQTQQSMSKAEAQVRKAERNLQLAKQTLGTLLGSTASSTEGLHVQSSDSDLSQLTITSSLTGTIESKSYSATERVYAQDELFVIADTTSLWVEADIRSRDWNSIKTEPGDTVMVTTPSVDLPPQRATVYAVGRKVDPASGSIPIIAILDNSEGLFRPGFFARMVVPTKTLSDVIVVRDSALVDLDGQESVFVSRGNGFFPVPVQVGSQSDGRVEIRSGLVEGQVVVITGAFTLKSELLLEGEE